MILPDQIKKAEIAMTKVGMRALELGVHVSKPIFEGSRYDLIIDKENKLYRVQVKYANGSFKRTTGAAYVNLRKQIKKNKNHPYMSDEIDVLLIYLPKIDRICWFGPEIFHGRQNLSIRYAPTKSGRIKGCIAADDFLW